MLLSHLTNKNKIKFVKPETADMTAVSLYNMRNEGAWLINIQFIACENEQLSVKTKLNKQKV